eukprot:2011329-Pleurochrysis_carterae.AAC.1
MRTRTSALSLPHKALAPYMSRALSGGHFLDPFRRTNAPLAVEAGTHSFRLLAPIRGERSSMNSSHGPLVSVRVTCLWTAHARVLWVGERRAVCACLTACIVLPTMTIRGINVCGVLCARRSRHCASQQRRRTSVDTTSGHQTLLFPVRWDRLLGAFRACVKLRRARRHRVLHGRARADNASKSWRDRRCSAGIVSTGQVFYSFWVRRFHNMEAARLASSALRCKGLSSRAMSLRECAECSHRFGLDRSITAMKLADAAACAMDFAF